MCFLMKIKKNSQKKPFKHLFFSQIFQVIEITVLKKLEQIVICYSVVTVRQQIQVNKCCNKLFNFLLCF